MKVEKLIYFNRKLIENFLSKIPIFIDNFLQRHLLLLVKINYFHIIKLDTINLHFNFIYPHKTMQHCEIFLNNVIIILGVNIISKTNIGTFLSAFKNLNETMFLCEKCSKTSFDICRRLRYGNVI